MIGAKVTIDYQPQTVVQAAEDATYRSLGHAAASIRLDAIESIQRDSGPSPAGQPPHTRRGLIRRAIRYFVDRAKQYAIIGTAASVIDQAGEPHEHGGKFRRQKFEPRPFMRPALLRKSGRLPDHWRDSIRG